MVTTLTNSPLTAYVDSAKLCNLEATASSFRLYFYLVSHRHDLKSNVVALPAVQRLDLYFKAIRPDLDKKKEVKSDTDTKRFLQSFMNVLAACKRSGLLTYTRTTEVTLNFIKGFDVPIEDDNPKVTKDAPDDKTVTEQDLDKYKKKDKAKKNKNKKKGKKNKDKVKKSASKKSKKNKKKKKNKKNKK